MRRSLHFVALAFGCWTLAGTAWAAAHPQPRVRLHREASGATATVEQKAAAPEDTVVVAKKYVVRDAKLPSPPGPLRDEARSSFSLREGGPLFVKSTERFQRSIGLWRHVELFGEEARFKPQETHAEFDLLRAKR